MNALNAAGPVIVRLSVPGTSPPTSPSSSSIQVTTTLNVPLDVLPCASRAVQVTVVVPTANTAPEAGSQVTAGFGSSLSVAVGGV